MGDPCGIGPEICVKLFAEGINTPAFVIGDFALLQHYVKQFKYDLKVNAVSTSQDFKHKNKTLSVMSLTSLDTLKPGQITAAAGQAAYDYVVKAIDLANAQEISGIVTAPIAKESMKLAGITYPGHTEILSAKSGTEDVAMMLANDELKVILVSIHVSLSEAIKRVTIANVLRTIKFADMACKSYGIGAPRIAVAGLNPHAGENGMFGREDLAEIVPAVEAAKALGLNAAGPFAPDTVFMRARRGEFDIVVAQYHDQGLIPVKYLGVDHGVNVTIGLPFVRTSVDHGTAFDIAGQNKASALSLRYAVEQAVKLNRNAAT